MEKYQIIDRKTWKRNIHCQIFQNSLEPQYCISLELDITNFLKMVKKHRYSFTFAFIYAVCKCANEIEEFRYRFLGDEVILYDRIHTSFTYLDAETESFKFVSVPMQENISHRYRGFLIHIFPIRFQAAKEILHLCLNGSVFLNGMET